jgi:hypothetical protein
VDVTPPTPHGAAQRACHALSAKLPKRVSDEDRRAVHPESELTAAWGDPAITLRCGVAKPRAYTPTAQLFAVNAVAWLPVPQDAANPTTFYAVERTAYVEVVVPKEQAPASDALVDLGKVIAKVDPKDPNAKP